MYEEEQEMIEEELIEEAEELLREERSPFLSREWEAVHNLLNGKKEDSEI